MYLYILFGRDEDDYTRIYNAVSLLSFHTAVTIVDNPIVLRNACTHRMET